MPLRTQGDKTHSYDEVGKQTSVRDGSGSEWRFATTFAALGIANDAFLQLVRTETHRGLEGRALGGFATDGRVYGYGSVKETLPPRSPRQRRAGPVRRPTHSRTGATRVLSPANSYHVHRAGGRRREYSPCTHPATAGGSSDVPSRGDGDGGAALGRRLQRRQ